MEEYEISQNDIEAVVRYLKINDPENATPEVAISLLEDLQAGVHVMAHSSPEKLNELFASLKRKNGRRFNI